MSVSARPSEGNASSPGEDVAPRQEGRNLSVSAEPDGGTPTPPPTLTRREWLALIRPGDWLVMAGALILCGTMVATLWRGGAPDKAIIRAGGVVFAELPLDRPRTVEVPGPLGTTLIEIQAGRARVLADPGPRQYCVRQGWLTRAGSAAICAPNQVSLALSGRNRDYDSLNY